MILNAGKGPSSSLSPKTRIKAAFQAVTWAIWLRHCKTMATLSPAELSVVRGVYFTHSPLTSIAALCPHLNTVGIVCGQSDVERIVAHHTFYNDGDLMQWRTLERIVCVLKQETLGGGSNKETDGHIAFDALNPGGDGQLDRAAVAAALKNFSLDVEGLLEAASLRRPLEPPQREMSKSGSSLRNMQPSPFNDAHGEDRMGFDEFTSVFALNGNSASKKVRGAKYGSDSISIPETPLPAILSRMQANGRAMPMTGSTLARSSSMLNAKENIQGHDSDPLTTGGSAENDGNIFSNGTLFPQIASASANNTNGNNGTSGGQAASLSSLETKNLFEGIKRWIQAPPPTLDPRQDIHIMHHHGSGNAGRSPRHVESRYRQELLRSPRTNPQGGSLNNTLNNNNTATPRHNAAEDDRSNSNSRQRPEMGLEGSPVGFSSTTQRFYPLKPLPKPAGTARPIPRREHFRDHPPPRKPRTLTPRERDRMGERLLAFSASAYQ